MNSFRRTAAWNKRNEANELANRRPHPNHYSNGDEQRFRHTKETAECHKEVHEKDKKGYYAIKNEGPLKIKGKSSYLVSFTKGMPHDYATGLLKNPQHFQYFIRAIDSGNPRDFRDTPLGPEAISGSAKNCHAPDSGWRSEKARRGKAKKGKPDEPVGLRAWESQSAGLAFELEGPDAQAVTMPPAPSLGSAELTAEMAEVYCQALLRDVPFHALSAGVVNLHPDDHGISDKHLLKCLATNHDNVKTFQDHTKKLSELKWFNEEISDTDLKLDVREEARRCMRKNPSPSTAFRGITRGDFVGPYISQFLLAGNTGINGNDNERPSSKGLITYGAVNTDQRVRVASPGVDYMTTWDEWMDVQEAAAVGGLESYVSGAGGRRFIYTPRDLATYVHYDALYEAYLNACLMMLSMGVGFDPGIPFQEDDNRDHQQGFAHFGGPHILSLVTEVATRALKAVRFQKYNIHRRCRPEVLAARVEKVEHLKHMAPELEKMVDHLGNAGILDALDNSKYKNRLLPMAFCEGSPMHPAYGAGHATVAGACVTILKAFFDHGAHLSFVSEKEILAYDKKIFEKVGAHPDHIHPSNMAYVAVDQGKKLEAIAVLDKNNKIAHLTVEGELNKLASNISIGRNWAGVHYFTDYYESILMGEQIAIGILEEQKLMFGENFSMTVPLFNGDSLRI